MSELSRLEDTMPRGFVVGCSMVNVNVRRKASVARAERAPRRMVGRRLVYGARPCRLCERSFTFP